VSAPGHGAPEFRGRCYCRAVPTLESQGFCGVRTNRRHAPPVKPFAANVRARCSACSVAGMDTAPRPRRSYRPLPDLWRTELRGRITRDGLRATARRLDVVPETLRRASLGAELLPLTVRALVHALAAGSLHHGGTRAAA
jgi:hypothetical protein